MANLTAIFALIIWSTLATAVVSIKSVDPMLVNGVCLLIGGVMGVFSISWRQLDWPVLLVGSLSMLLYHLIYFFSLGMADPVIASLIHYLWPLVMILISPILLPQTRLSWLHLLFALLALWGVYLCTIELSDGHVYGWLGYGLAFVSAIVWAYYSVWSKRIANIPFYYVSLYCLFAGLASLLMFFGWQQDAALAELARVSGRAWWTMLYLGLGPLGGAFYLWDFAMKRGNPSKIAMYSYAVPVVSTLFVTTLVGRVIGIELIIGSALVALSILLSNRVATAHA